MKKNLLVRIMLIVLTLAMLMSVAACADSDENPNDTTTGGTTAANPDGSDAVSTGPTAPDPIPNDVKFDGKKMTVLYWSDREHEEFFVEGTSGDPVETAIFDRNTRVEERLGIEIVWEGQDGDSGYISEYNDRMKTTIDDNQDSEFVVFATYSLSASAAAINGYASNLISNTYDNHLNFENNLYWPESLLNEVKFGDNLFFCSGDISANALYMMYVCFVNTDLLDVHDLQNPQELVEDGNWTYTRFITMCADVWEDLDGDGVKSDGDQFGYMTSGIHSDVWFYGTGAKIAEYNDAGELRVSTNFDSESTADQMDKIKNQLNNTNDMIYTDSVLHQRAFGEGRLLFCMDRCRISFKVFAGEGYEVNYVIVPCPKATAKQEKYVTIMGNPFTCYGLFNGISNEAKELGSAFLEYYAYQSYLLVTPAVFELSLKVKYVEDEVSGRMYDIVRETLSFDAGRIFNESLSTIGGQGFMRSYFNPSNSTSWAITSRNKVTPINNKLRVIQETLEQPVQ